MVNIINVSFIRSMAILSLDDDRKVWISRSDFNKSGWHENSSVSKEAFDRFIQIHQYPRALNHAVSLLARRPYTRAEIESSLKRHHYSDDVIEIVLYKLEKEKFLNDREFSDLWIQQRSEKYGSRRIRQELHHKGVSQEIAEEALSNISEEDELKTAVKIARKIWLKAKSGEDPRKYRQKVISALVRKGYDWDTAKQAADTAEK